MLIYEKELRINIVDVINHPYFEEFEKTPITNFNNFNKIERINNKLNYFHIIHIQNSILPINYINKYVNYTKDEYFNNMYEIKYKHIHFENYLNQKVSLDKICDKICDKNFDKYIDKKNFISYSKIFNIDSYVNTIIFLKKEKNFNKINKNFLNEYFLMLCIIFNSIFTYNLGRITYDIFNNLCQITYDNFNFIYIECIKLIYADLNIYFFYAILSFYLDEIIYEYELINPDYLVNLKIKCIDFFICLIKEKVITEINFITLIKYSINTVLANILNKNIIEYNLSPIINSMKLTNEDIKLFS
jgi:hypothetical protein